MPPDVLWTPVRDYLRSHWPLLPIAPAAGTREWIELPDNDPRKIAALITAGSRYVLELDLAQRDCRDQALKDAATAIAAQRDWAAVAKRIRDRDQFYAQHPDLRRKAA